MTDNFGDPWHALTILVLCIGITIVPMMKNPDSMYSKLDEILELFKKKKVDNVIAEPEGSESNLSVPVSKKRLRKQSMDSFREIELISARSMFSDNSKRFSHKAENLEILIELDDLDDDEKNKLKQKENDEFKDAIYSVKFIG